MSEETIELLTTVGIIGGGILGFLFLCLFMIKSFLLIGKPNELLIFSGRQRRLPDGTPVGWRTVRGGRSFRVPLIDVARTSSGLRCVSSGRTNIRWPR